MSHFKIRDKFLSEILTHPSFDQFTIIELRDRFLEVSKSKLSPDEARKKVYRLIYKLHKEHGWLEKIESSNIRESKYRKTNAFYTVYPKELPDPCANMNAPTPSHNALSSTLDVIQERHYHAKVDLDACLAEVAQYKSLGREFPDLLPITTAKIEEAKVRSTELLGTFRALDAVLQNGGLSA